MDRSAIVEMIERFELGFKVVAEASGGKEAWHLKAERLNDRLVRWVTEIQHDLPNRI